MDVGRFDVATIGRALYWMATEPTAALFDRLVAPGAGAVHEVVVSTAQVAR